MPFLAAAKRRVGHRLNSSATVSEAAQNQLCAYLSIALLIGLLANALVGWWWADPAAALVSAALARQGRHRQLARQQLRLLQTAALIPSNRLGSWPGSASGQGSGR
jgi:divalent metal cation (Fe/Co/Zn/Cd) transporter